MKMLIDFCNTDLVTRISSSVCECEGYSVDNLISKVEIERNKGFLVDYFIKPPVMIELQFLCEIQLSHVILWPRIGGQKTTGVELLTRIIDDNVYNSVGSAFMKSDDAAFLFLKHDDKSVKQIDSHNFLVQTFKSLRFLHTRSLQIKILKTSGSSVPALQRVEIWGEVYRNCPKKTLDMVMKAWADVESAKTARFAIAKDNTTKKCMKPSSSHCSSSVVKFHGNIPDEFLDPISCEIMMIPMIMPSGKIIDNSTLERYIEEEARWGRFPSDPFTGKLFTETSRPKISDALKTRIDKFLLDNCDEIYCKNLPRTVGNCSNANVPFVSSLVSSNKANMNKFLSSSHKLHVLEPTSNQGCTSAKNISCHDNKRKFSCTGIEENDKSVEYNKHCSGSVTNMKPLHSSSKTTLQKYDEMKDKSLECWLKTTLSNLPSFTKNMVSQTYRVLCFKCNSGSILYEIPCKHHICRLCLSSMKEKSTGTLMCMVCSEPFNTSDPKRTHCVNR